LLYAEKISEVKASHGYAAKDYTNEAKDYTKAEVQAAGDRHHPWLEVEERGARRPAPPD